MPTTPVIPQQPGERAEQARLRAQGKVRMEMSSLGEQIKLAQTDIGWTQERLAEQQQRLALLEDDYAAMQALLDGLV